MSNALSLSILLNVAFLAMLWIARMKRKQLNGDLSALAGRIAAQDIARRLGPPEGAHGVFDPRATGGRSIYERMILTGKKEEAYWHSVHEDIDDLTQPFSAEEG